MMWKHFLVIFGSFYEISDALCCNHGTSPDLAAKSCLEVVLLSPGCKDLSGYYWLETTTGSVEQVYCDMSSSGGGWERIAYHNSELSVSCPGNMGNYRLGSFLVCTNNNGSSNITSAQYTPVTQSYSQVMGLMTGYISDSGQGFRLATIRNWHLIQDFNVVYMDGINLGIEDNTGFIKHVHSTPATDRANTIFNLCYEYVQYPGLPPATVGADLTCTVMISDMFMPLNGTLNNATQFFGDTRYGSCEIYNRYCRRVHRYFLKTLPKQMSSADNPLIVRVMSANTLSIGMNFLDIYVR